MSNVSTAAPPIHSEPVAHHPVEDEEHDVGDHGGVGEVRHELQLQRVEVGGEAERGVGPRHVPHRPELVHPVVAHVDKEVPRQQRADGEVVEDEGDEAGALLCLRHPDSDHPHRLASELE